MLVGVLRTVPRIRILHITKSQNPRNAGTYCIKNQLEKNYFKNAASKMISLYSAHYSHLSKHTAWVIKNLNLIFLKTSGP